MIRIVYHTSYRDVPVAIWESFAPHKAVGLELAHLQAVEESGINDIHPYYFIGYRGSSPIGIAYCFSIRVNLARMANNIPAKILETVKTWNPDFMDMKIIEVGHIASVGSSIAVTESNLPDFLDGFCDSLGEIAIKENADLCFFRDVVPEHLTEYSVLEKKGFSPVMGYPIARLPLKWNSFDGYLAALKSKKRNNICRKRKALNVPEISVEIIEDYAGYANRLADLWTNVAKANNGYEHEKLTPAYFEAMARCLKGRSHVVAIKLRGEIVAFGLNLIGDEEYFGVAEGLDYSVRDTYELYANNIFEALRVACDRGQKCFNIGITTYDFKISIGAELDASVYFVKSFKNENYGAVYADLFRKAIDQPDNKHRVFADHDISARTQLGQIARQIESYGEPLDPFSKHLNYTRVDAGRAAGLYAFYPVFEGAQEPVIRHDGRDVIMLGTNSYLGLATHPQIKRAAIEAIEKYGSGCSGSPLLNGTLDLHDRLERELSQFTKKEAALIFSTGYQTNVGAVSALVNRHDVIIMDERNHASLVDGALLSRATLVRYKHNDVTSLEEALKKCQDRPKLVVTDSLFSMEGTMVDLPKIIGLVHQYKARLMLDESHAIGVIGENGQGVAEYFQLQDQVDVIMGTFSKSLASIGGFVAGDQKIIDTLKHTARSHIFSASLPPSAVAAVLAAMKIINEEPERRQSLLENTHFMADGLRNLGFGIDYHGSAIIPVFCGHEMIALGAFRKLLNEGVFVNPVTSPAVPKDKEMLRVSLMATHEKNTLERALDKFAKIRIASWPER